VTVSVLLTGLELEVVVGCLGVLVGQAEVDEVSPSRLAAMSEAAGSGGDAVALTVVTMTTGERYEIDGSAESVETAIVGASRGSIMQLAWLTEAGTGRSIAINPLHVVALETAASPSARG
jgi:hypothetical protein